MVDMDKKKPMAVPVEDVDPIRDGPISVTEENPKLVSKGIARRWPER